MASRSFSHGILLGAAILVVTLPAISARAALVIADAATQNVVCSAGICTATARDAVLGISDLQTMLAVSSVTVATGTVAHDIGVQAKLAWQGATGLTLDSGRFVVISAPLIVGTGQALAVVTYGGRHAEPESFRFSNGGFVRFDDLAAILTIDGTPYTLVANIPDLAAGIAASPSGNFALAAGYNSFAREGVFPTAAVPTPFSGHFEGLGNTISFLKIRRTVAFGAPSALFASVLAGGVVHNLTLSDAGIRGDVDGRAGIAAADNAGKLVGIAVSGEVKVSGNSIVGGLVGVNSGQVIQCKSSATIEAAVRKTDAGGLVGENGATGSVDQSFATGDVYGGGSKDDVGGLAGLDEGALTNSYAIGPVSVGDVGLVDGGGLVGLQTGGFVASSYTTGVVSVSMQPIYIHAGAFAGRIIVPTSCSACYWDTTTSPLSYGISGYNPAEIVGLSDAQLKSGLPPYFDSTIWAGAPGVNGGLPYLINNPP